MASGERIQQPAESIYSVDSNRIFRNDKDQQVLVVSGAPGRSLLSTIALF